jgi:phage gp16-like protein
LGGDGVPSRKRLRDLAAIHAEKKRLCLDDATYRALLARVAGVRSAADLDAQGRAEVLREFARLSRTRTAAEQMALPDAPKAVREELTAMIGKTGAMLAEAERSWNYAHGLAQRMFGVRRVEWLHAEQLHKLVAALVFDQRRRRKKPSPPKPLKGRALIVKQADACTPQATVGATEKTEPVRARPLIPRRVTGSPADASASRATQAARIN